MFVFSNQNAKFPYVHVIMENETKKKILIAVT